MNLTEHLLDQRAVIEAELLLPKVLQEAALCHRVMYISGHDCTGFVLAESGPVIGVETCARCGAAAEISVVKRPGHDAIVMLVLPPGRCPHPHPYPELPGVCSWTAPYTNLAPDGESNGRRGL